MKINGNLIVTKENQNDFKKLTEVSGYVDVRQGATFTAPVLSEVSGYVDVRQGATFTAPVLSEVSGYVDVQEGATFTAPALTKSGSVYVQEGATFTAPAFSEVSGYVDVRQGATFTAPVLSEVSGYVDVRQGATFTAPALTKSGSVCVQEGATFTAPALSEVSGSVYVQEGATFTAPALSEVSGYVYVRQGATFTAPALTKSGSVYVQEGATFTAPALVVKNNLLKIKSKEYSVNTIDGVLMFIESSKTSKGIKISSGIFNLSILDNKVVFENIVLAEKEGFYAHGSTIKKAISDLRFKIISEKLKNEPIKEYTLLTVKYYRLITGACDIGTRDFMQRNGLEFEVIDGETKEINPIKAKDLLPLLEKNNAYGVEKFKSLYEA